jgi:hypothetical protein
VVILFCAVIVAGSFASAATASATTGPACATTVGAGQPSLASPGNPCWTAVTPYPFGFAGTAIDPNSQACINYQLTFNVGDDPALCYLTVDSMAFRAWNRGLAAVSPNGGGSTPYAVWRYNGSQWYPDPSFPGQSTCAGNTVLWAGKLDFWLIGQNAVSQASWPKLCRFDGVADDWEPLAIPKAALAQVPTKLNQVTGASVPEPGSINAGACFAWNNCWFFGTYGVVLHWDGNTLGDASVGAAGSPWLEGDYSAATVGSAGGSPFALAVSATHANAPGPAGGQEQIVPAEPDGTPPPQLLRSAGGPFSPTSYVPPTVATANDPFRTDLTAIAANASGNVWAAGDPSDFYLSQGAPTVRGRPLPNNEGNSPTTGLAPLVALSSSGNPVSCPDTPSNAFVWNGGAAGSTPADQYLWTSVGVFPDGDALAGGEVSENGSAYPAITDVSCAAGAPNVVAFPALGGIPAISSVAVNAANDAWAATAGAPAQLYHLTDGQTPEAAAGNDLETRPVIPAQVQINYEVSPAPTQSRRHHRRTRYVRGRTKHLKAPIYGVRVKVRKVSRTTFVLEITFKVRRSVVLGAKALRHGKLVSSARMTRFRPTHGELLLKLHRNAWPTKIEFVQPPTKKHSR